MLSHLLILVLEVSLTLATFVVKDYHKAPPGWYNTGRAPADHVLNLRIGLTQSNFPELVRQLYEVSDPRHSKYGQHLSTDQVHELVRPRDESLAGIEEWLDQAGVSASDISYTPAKTWAMLPITVADAEALLDTEFSVWKHQDGSTLVRTESYSVPENLYDHITTIQPTNSWARTERRIPIHEVRSTHYKIIDELPEVPPLDSGVSNSAVAAACNFSAVTPDCLRTLYGTINYTVSANSKSTLGVNNFLGEYNNRSDTYLFLEKYRPEAASYAYSFPEISIADGPVDNGTNTAISDPSVALEGNLDSEYIIGVGFPLELTTYSTGGSNPSFMPDLQTPTNSDEPFLTWANYILSQQDIPWIVSTSYGDDEQTVSRSYAEAVCNEFAQLGARGVTLLFASGDYGVGADGTCYSNIDNTTYQFLPSFPNDCPWVTNVGGTRSYPESAMDVPIRGSDGRYASGAGFSNYFDAPDYQKDTVDAYISGLNGLYDGFYNKSGKSTSRY